jgi:hypothetical protein
MEIVKFSEETGEKMCLVTGHAIRTPIRYQSITEAKDPGSGARVKVWREELELPVYNDVDLQMIIRQIPGSASMQDVINIIGSLPRVVKVELVDPDGNGAFVEFLYKGEG